MKHTRGMWTALKTGIFTYDPTLGVVCLARIAEEVPVEEQLANARLMAAAPDLLCALKKVLGSVSQLPVETGEYAEFVIRTAEALAVSDETHRVNVIRAAGVEAEKEVAHVL